jgi:transposase-like protein
MKMICNWLHRRHHVYLFTVNFPHYECAKCGRVFAKLRREGQAV